MQHIETLFLTESHGNLSCESISLPNIRRQITPAVLMQGKVEQSEMGAQGWEVEPTTNDKNTRLSQHASTGLNQCSHKHGLTRVDRNVLPNVDDMDRGQQKKKRQTTRDQPARPKHTYMYHDQGPCLPHDHKGMYCFHGLFTRGLAAHQTDDQWASKVFVGLSTPHKRFNVVMGISVALTVQAIQTATAGNQILSFQNGCNGQSQK